MSHHRIVVTGGAGFVGSNLCARLVAAGNEVVCIDDFTTGRRENIARLLDHRNFRLVEHDVCTPFDEPCDRIYNLACPASPPHYQRDPVRTMLINVLGMLHVLQVAERHGARVFQASTSEIYGDPLVHPQVESYRGNVSSIGPRACYDEGKRAAEARTHLERALEADPRCVGCLARLAHVAYLAGDDRQCESWLARALALDPGDVETHLVAGMLANRAGRHEQAIRHLVRVVDELPGSTSAQYQIALAYRRTGNTEKAREHQAIYDRLIREQKARTLGIRGAED